MAAPKNVDRGLSALLVDNVEKTFIDPKGQALQALDYVTMNASPGEFVSIVGPSGCGKTTILRMMQGLDSPDNGSVLIQGKVPGTEPTGFVFQHPSLLPWRSVERNISFGCEMAVLKGTERKPSSRHEMKARVQALLSLTGLEGFGHFYPRQLSGGMAQRANLARSLAIQPVALFMDEPFSALDAQTREKLQRDLQHVVAETMITTVFITHDVSEAAFQADRVFVMSPRPGQMKEVFEVHEPHPRTKEFQQSDRLAGIAREIWKCLHDSA